MKACLIGLCLLPATAFSQVVISSSTIIAVANTPEISIVTGSNISNGSSFEFTGTQLSLDLTGTDQTISGTFNASRFRVGGGGTKLVNGILNINSEINFTAGFLKPAPSGKIFFTGSESGLSGASAESFVDGKFFCAGSGLLRFPVGRAGLGFAPISLENGPGGEIAVEVFNASAGLVPAISEVEILDILNTPYWEISGNVTALNTRVKLTPPGLPALPENSAAIIVEADVTDGEAYNAGGILEADNAILSTRNITKPILTIGASTEFDITIRDLISPFKVDDRNDYLEIDKIDKFPKNKVTLLDRYGVLIKEWKNFTNFNDRLNPNTDTFNFARLSPGNYICIVEYGNEATPTKKKSQMVTVLKN